MGGLRTWATVATFVAVTLLCAAGVESKSKHYAVRVKDPADLQQVADALTRQGLIVQRINKRFGFVSVRTLDTAAGPAAMPPTAGPIAAPCSDPFGCTTGDTASFPGPPPANERDASAAIAAADPSIAAALAALPVGVEVEEDAQVYMMGRVPARSLLQDESEYIAGAAAAASDVTLAATAVDSCAALPDSGMTGRLAEAAPYGITMVQGTDDTVIQLSKDFKSKVMFCIIDTGIDRTHWEFSKDDTSGCVPNTKRPNTGTTTNCKNDWGVDNFMHGTHTGGTVGALRNGKGVVGVSASGAQIYEYNSFGSSDTFSMTLVIDAWQDCIAELDERKAATGQKDLKMVISMSIGSEGDVKVVRQAMKQLATERAQDVLWVAAAGNGAQQGSVYSYPAAYPECVSVAAVDWTMAKAPFSQVNDDLEWAAPGVQTLSTIPVKNAADAKYNTQPSIAVASGNLAASSSDVFTKPGPSALTGSKNDVVTAGLFDCGTGAAACTGATGKICLLERGGNMFCEKVNNCILGGGVGAIIYGKADQPACQTFDGVLNYDGCPNPTAGWPVAVTVSRGQGDALKTLSKDPAATITLDARASSDPLPLDFLSGTSMATPTASGVVGLVWSAHTACSAAEVRTAISLTALDVGKKGRDDEFGYGIVQAAAAHKYLLEHPCSGNTTAQPPSTGSKPKPKNLRTLTITTSADGVSAAAVGSKLQFTITVGKTVDAQQIAKVSVRVTTSKHLACEKARVVTDANGVAVVSCAVKSAGTARFTAAIGSADRTVTAISRIKVVQHGL